MADVRLELYIVGQSRNSVTAAANLRRLCEGALAGRCDVQVVDLLEHPEAAEAANIIATPLLIRRAPLPVMRIVGDLSDTPIVLETLDLGEGPERNEDSEDGRNTV
ncbi:MAG TPA: circadian clock KaiB family protein [Vicinamibacterales bacterium]